MLTLYHAPNSRSSRILWLMDEMGIADRIDVRRVSITRFDGSGARDPANPHPEGKVPILDHDGTLISETGAIMLYLTDLFPDTPMAPKLGDRRRGAYLTWLFWYGGMMEPALIHDAAGLKHPYLADTFRGVAEIIARLSAALEHGPWLLGDTFTAADLLVHSPYAWFQSYMPTDPKLRDWAERCMARPAKARTAALDAAEMV